MERELPRARRGSGRDRLFAPEQTKLAMRLVDSGRVLHAVALRLELARAAPPRARARAVAPRRPGPVARLDAPGPRGGLIQLHPDRPRLLAAVVGADVGE